MRHEPLAPFDPADFGVVASLTPAQPIGIDAAPAPAEVNPAPLWVPLCIGAGAALTVAWMLFLGSLALSVLSELTSLILGALGG